MNAETFLKAQRELDAELSRMPRDCAAMIATLLEALHEQEATIRMLLAVNHRLLNK